MNDRLSQKVSVIVPFYNAGARLRVALTSIAASSHRNLEVLMIDDASTDDSAAAAVEFASADVRFRCFRNDQNRRVSFSRNRGLEEATGVYVLFVDSDDRISHDWIEGLLQEAVAQDADITIGKTIRSQGGREEPYRMKGLRRRGELDFASIVLKDNSVVWNKLYSAALIRRAGLRFNPSLDMGEDLLFNYRAMSQANRTFYSDRGYYFYQADHEGSIMRGSDAAARVANFSRLLQALEDYNRIAPRTNRAVLQKVAKDILVNQHASDNKAGLDPDTMNRIRRADRFLPEKVRFSFWRKSMRGKLISSDRATPPG